MDRYEKLANAIILQAVDDYRLACRQLKRTQDYRPAIRMKCDVELFLRSEWLTKLTRLDGDDLLRRLNAEAAV